MLSRQSQSDIIKSTPKMLRSIRSLNQKGLPVIAKQPDSSFVIAELNISEFTFDYSNSIVVEGKVYFFNVSIFFDDFDDIRENPKLRVYIFRKILPSLSLDQ